jgi:Fic family protein
VDPEAFKCEKAGFPRRQAEGYWAFVPAPPPMEVAYTPELTRLLSEADATLSELSGLGRYLPNPNLLIEPYMRREAVASSRIEGTQADLDDLLLDELEPADREATGDVREVRNYVTAMRLGIARLGELPLSCRLVRELHGTLMKGVRGEHATPGEFRRSQNWIGPPGSTLATASYVPPPVAEMKDCLTAWERFVHVRDTMPDLVQCAVMHEHFEAIHPFIDGNGRVGRLLITLFLIERSRLSKPLLYLSSHIERHRREYYELLMAIRTDCAWDDWLRYFLVAVRDSSRSALKQGDELLAVRDAYGRELEGRHRGQALMEMLFVNPYTTAARAAENLNVSRPTAMKTIEELEKAGLLTEMTGQSWGRRWAAEPILSVLRGEQG